MSTLLDKIMMLENYLDNTNDNKQLKELLENLKVEVKHQEEEIAILGKEVAAKKREVEFYLAALSSLPNPIFIKNEKAEFVFFNDAYKKFFNVSDNMYIGKTVFALEYLPEEERIKYHNEDLGLITNSSVLSYKTSFASEDETEKSTLYWSSGFKSKNEIKGLVGEIVDISLEKKLQDDLRNAVEELENVNNKLEVSKKYDHLTNLHNRYEMEPFLDCINKMRKKQKYPVSVLLADLDHFKLVNDNYGHLYGDEVLVEFADILKKACRKHDAIIRYGGEEFLIILTCRDIQAIKEIAEKIRKTCEKKLILPNKTSLTVSIGGTEFVEGEVFQTCLKRTDDALYEAKSSGRNKVVIK